MVLVFGTSFDKVLVFGTSIDMVLVFGTSIDMVLVFGTSIDMVLVFGNIDMVPNTCNQIPHFSSPSCEFDGNILQYSHILLPIIIN
jgi:hypothetical protein